MVFQKLAQKRSSSQLGPRSTHLVCAPASPLKGSPLSSHTHMDSLRSTVEARTPKSSKYQYKAFEGAKIKNFLRFTAALSVRDEDRIPRYPKAPVSQRTKLAPACRLTEYPCAVNVDVFKVVKVGNVKLDVRERHKVGNFLTEHRRYQDIPQGWGDKFEASKVTPRVRVKKIRTQLSPPAEFTPRWDSSDYKINKKKKKKAAWVEDAQGKLGPYDDQPIRKAWPIADTVPINHSPTNRGWQCSDKFFIPPESAVTLDSAASSNQRTEPKPAAMNTPLRVTRQKMARSAR